jgi:hypothetical protein
LAPQAYKIYTEEGSRYIARFDPQFEQEGVLYGSMCVIGYSEVVEKHLRIVGMSAVPEPGGRLIVEDKPWAVEIVDGETVPLYEYENISLVEDLTHVLEKMLDEDTQEEKQEV